MGGGSLYYFLKGNRSCLISPKKGLLKSRASLIAQLVKNLTAMQETQVRFPGWEDSVEKEINNPLQYSCLENPVDGGARQATGHRAAKSWTQLKRLSMQALRHSSVLGK